MFFEQEEINPALNNVTIESSSTQINGYNLNLDEIMELENMKI